MSGNDLAKILSDNGFNYYDGYVDRFKIIKNLEIINYEPLVEYIDVEIKSNKAFYVYINFKDNIPQITNFGLSFSVDNYRASIQKYIYICFDNKNDFIEELYRLNSNGQNIKG